MDKHLRKILNNNEQVIKVVRTKGDFWAKTTYVLTNFRIIEITKNIFGICGAESRAINNINAIVCDINSEPNNGNIFFGMKPIRNALCACWGMGTADAKDFYDSIIAEMKKQGLWTEEISENSRKKQEDWDN